MEGFLLPRHCAGNLHRGRRRDSERGSDSPPLWLSGLSVLWASLDPTAHAGPACVCRSHPRCRGFSLGWGEKVVQMQLLSLKAPKQEQRVLVDHQAEVSTERGAWAGIQVVLFLPEARGLLQ